MNTAPRSPLSPAGRIRKLQLAWVRRRWLDLGIALFVVGLWLEAGRRGWVPLALENVAAPQRQAFYQIVAAAAATLAGFTLTSVSVLVNLLRTPMSAIERLLPDDDKRRVGGAVIGVLPGLLALFGTALAGVLGDSTSSNGHWWLQALLGVTLLASVLALSRVGWVLRRLLVVSNTL